jgi:hypothetical protein
MASGSARDFIIGAGNWGGAIANYYDGKVAMFRVRNQVLTQKDVDLGYAVKYTKPTLFLDNDYILSALVKEDGSNDFISQVNWGGMEVCRNSSYIYRYGGILGATDKLRIFGRE